MSGGFPGFPIACTIDGKPVSIGDQHQLEATVERLVHAIKTYTAKLDVDAPNFAELARAINAWIATAQSLNGQLEKLQADQEQELRAGVARLKEIAAQL